MAFTKTITIFTLILTYALSVCGQWETESYLVSGQNQTQSEGFMNLALSPSCRFNDWKFGVGMELALLNPQNSIINVWDINVERKINIKKHEFKLYSGFFYRPFSEYVRELNVVFEIKYEWPHWKFMAGNNSRIYRLSSKAREQWPEANPSETDSYKEWRNLLYDFSYRIKTGDSKWNFAVGLSNTNGFFFNQETTPMLFSRYENKIAGSLMLYAECWLQQAGSANLQTQYYGFFVKGGLVWKSLK